MATLLFPFMNNRVGQNLAAFAGFLAVLLGALGSHALRTRLEALGTTQFWQTGALYHLTHSVVLLVLASRRPLPRLAFYLIFFGMVLFSGSLYLLALSNARWLGAITPLGGLGMLFGWIALLSFRSSGQSIE
jgi:uncharacterized membrane protein YgdD (TMEM256/DUF423 family)